MRSRSLAATALLALLATVPAWSKEAKPAVKDPREPV